MSEDKKTNSKINEKNNPVSVPSNIFVTMEEAALDFWEKENTFNKSLEKDAPNGEYVFYDGPPFITGLPHYATLLPSIAKDVIPRFWTMNGYRVGRVWGWDCHGLPAENKVEKELGLKNKKDIEVLGVGKFVDACREYVSSGSEQWLWYINRIGRWVDMENAYRTMDLNFMESVMWGFKQLFDKGLIYEGYRTSLHCPRCATPLSKFEITMDAGSYQDVTEESLVAKFKIKKEENTYFLAWTTTPWTLPGNLALAVGNDINYSLVELDNTKYILATELVEKIIPDGKGKVLREFKGSTLVGSEYEPLFVLTSEKISGNKNAFKVYAADFVNTEEGTGIVHIAPNFGEDDFELGKKVDLPLVDLMDENGTYTKEAGDFANLYYKKAGAAVMSQLGDKLFSSFMVTHSYPFCYRCGTPLIYRAQKAWYLDIKKLKDQLVDANETINWAPELFKEGRFRYNLENAPDWCLSRSRYWGSPIPVWRCACGEMKVPGSLAEIEKLSGQKITDLHKPGIDEVFFECEKCGGNMKRVTEVLDCWFESGSMPFAQFHYPFEKKEEFEKSLLPADFIIEYTGQLRGWFYYLHVLSNALFDSVAFKNVIVTGVLSGTDGRKMSKSYGNYPDPRATIEKYGADALRYYFMASPIMSGDDTSLNEKDIQDALRGNQMLLWNVFKFYEMYATDFEFGQAKSAHVLDKWILAKLSILTNEITDAMKAYNLPKAVRPIGEFINELSTWYLRRSRDRFKSDDLEDKKNALSTMNYVLIELAKLMAPFMPFMAENLWQRVNNYNFIDGNKSVHLEKWPEKNDEDNSKLLADMEAIRKIVELGLAKRDEAGIKIRQMLGKITVTTKDTIASEYIDLIKDELNLVAVEFIKATEDKIEVELDTEITPELKAEGLKREVIRFVNMMRKDANLSLGDETSVYLAGASDELKTTLENKKIDIMKDTLSRELNFVDALPEVVISKEVKIDEEKLMMGLTK